MSDDSTLVQIKELEVRQENFLSIFEKFTENTDKNFTLLTGQSSEIALSLAELSSSNKHLEKSLLREVSAIKDAQHVSSCKITKLEKQVLELEVNKATVEGYKQAKDEQKSFWVTNWFNIIKFIGILSSGLGVVYYVANHVVKV